MSPRPIFVAATRQHVGKTSVSLALVAGLQKRFSKVGFIKPVGQEHVAASPGSELRVDKDVQLMKEYFALDHLNYSDMSPVLVPRGYTQNFIDGKITSAEQSRLIVDAYENVSAKSDAVLCEGTGHVGVGSIIELSNAAVAAKLGADVILVANGGLGSAFDELEMNRIQLKEFGVRVCGVVLNKVMPEKVEMIRDYFGRVCTKRWGVPLLGVVPDLPFLGKASLGDLERLLKAELIAGTRFRPLHFGLKDVQAVTTGVRRFLRKAAFRQAEYDELRPLYVTHCTRDDILLGYLAHYKRNEVDGLDGSIDAPAGDRHTWLGALVMCHGDSSGLSEHPEDERSLPYLMEIAHAYDAPIMLTQYGTIEATDKIAKFTAKMNIGDTRRVRAAIDHYEPHIDFDLLLERASLG